MRDYVSTRPLMKWLLRWYAGRASAAIGNSNSVANDVQSVCGPELETFCVYNAIDLKRYSPLGEKIDLDLLAKLDAAPQGTVRIGLAATLAHWKGHAVFLKALARLPKNLPFRAYVIGGPIYQTEHSQRTIWDLRELSANWESPIRSDLPDMFPIARAPFARSTFWFTRAHSPSRSGGSLPRGWRADVR